MKTRPHFSRAYLLLIFITLLYTPATSFAGGETYKSYKLTCDDFKAQVESQLKVVLAKIYDSAKAGKIEVFKDKELTNRFSIGELTQNVNCLIIPIYDSEYLFEIRDSTICNMEGGWGINRMEMDFVPDVAGKYQVSGKYVKLTRMSSKSIIDVVEEISYYLAPAIFNRILENIDKETFNGLAQYGKHIQKKTIPVIISDWFLRQYGAYQLKGINDTLYNEAKKGKIKPYTYSTFKDQYSIPQLVKRCKIEEIITYLPDPNDPYDVRDTTLKGEFDKIGGDMDSICIEVQLLASNELTGIAPFDLGKNRAFFYCKWTNAGMQLSARQREILTNVILDRIRNDGW